MTRHDASQKGKNPLFSAHALIEQISPEFARMTLDIGEVEKHSRDPALIAVLLFKLAQERHDSNRALEEMNRKYDELMLYVKTNATNPLASTITLQNNTGTMGLLNSVSVLPEADQKILKIVEAHQQVDAEAIRKELNYKNTNAASQRLNVLVKSGHLAKVQSGRKVIFLLHHA